MTAVYLSVIAVAFLLHATSPAQYGVLRDFVALAVAAPAAWLAWAYQRRLSYMHALRQLWSDAVASVQSAFRYTCTPAPSQLHYSQTLSNLATTIEQVRGVFKNVDEVAGTGRLYPFEQLKLIHSAIFELGYGEDASEDLRQAARLQITRCWKPARAPLLLEFDRSTPTYRGDLESMMHDAAKRGGHQPSAAAAILLQAP